MRRKKRAARGVADAYVDTGVLPPGPMSYATYVGIVLNGPRMVLRRVYFQGLAHSLAGGSGDVPFAVVAAACDSVEAARELAFEINAARASSQKGF